MDLPDYRLPKFKVDINELSTYPPRNHRGSGQKVFATFFVTRNASLHDPYFLNTQQLIYRLLWDEKIKSKQPVVVFVPPFIPDEQRAYFSAAGAIVREVEVRDFKPQKAGVVPSRLRDMFTKLEMWRQTDFERIVYLDSDAFPFRNLDPIFDIAKKQHCVKERLSKHDRAYANSICDYIFAAWPEELGDHQLNAGVMVLKPNMPMYERLIREMNSSEPHQWNEAVMEQAFLDHMFSFRSPFPSRNLSHEWNGEITDEAKDPRIVHGKIWSVSRFGQVPPDLLWVIRNYNQTWDAMLNLYESKEFVEMRKLDLDEAMGKPKPTPTPKVEAPKEVKAEENHDADAAEAPKADTVEESKEPDIVEAPKEENPQESTDSAAEEAPEQEKVEEDHAPDAGNPSDGDKGGESRKADTSKELLSP